jgi:hypothetical protein
MQHSTKLVKVSVSSIVPGDTVIIDGQDKTVCPNNITVDPLFGTCLFGQNFYKEGRMVEQVLYPRFYKGEYIGHKSQ